jgi:heme oxygenase (biliverdin-IX-beta and delta-forming)
MSLVSDLGIMQELKLRTAAHHRKLEEEADIWPALSSRADYQELIISMFRLYGALEARLKRVEGLNHFLPNLDERWKTGMLSRDVSSLGACPLAGELCDENPEIGSLASAFGCLYVLEGSTLGGQMISREVRAKLGFTPECGCEFFSSYGDRVGLMWKTFTGHLEAFCSTHPDGREEMIEGALATFEYFISQFAGNKLCAIAQSV